MSRKHTVDSYATPAGISKRARAVKLHSSPFPTPSLRIQGEKGGEEVCKDPGTWNDGWATDRKSVTCFNPVLESVTRSMITRMVVLKWSSEAPGVPRRYLRAPEMEMN